MASFGANDPSRPLTPSSPVRTSSPNMAARYPMPGSPSSASGMCPGSPQSPVSARSLDDLLICPVCLDEYREPKTLNCLHSFCYKCLESCKRPYRRDIVCPVCKKVTPLSGFGVSGLQNDFRIQQIRDILLNRPNSPGTSVEEMVHSGGDGDSKWCDLCKSHQKNTAASSHCIQCYMYFCEPCMDKHNANTLFASHHVISMSESATSDTLFCKNHKEHPVRYFCKPCSQMMCTICTMDHDPNHTPEPLEKGIIDKYRHHLQDSLRMVRSKMSEVNSCSKYLETVKQSHQRASHEAQAAIKERTDDVISKIRSQEQTLLSELRRLVDTKLKENGIDNLGEINFLKGTMDTLYSDIQRVIQGSPQDCLIAYEDIASRMKALSETSLPSVSKSRKKLKYRFVPSTSDMNIILGSLQECTISDVESSDDENLGTSTSAGSTQSSYSTLLASSPKSQLVTRRVSSILNAISPSRKSEAKKVGKVKAFSNAPGPTEKSPSSPTTINADELVASESSSVGPSSSVPGAAMAAPDDPLILQHRIKPVFKVDQIGGWPGRIASPSSVAFLPDGNLIVSECENRLQVFDKTGHSVRIIGWGKIKPQTVVTNPEGHLLVTDKKDRCVKVFDINGDMLSAWGSGLFSIPSGLAICSNGNYVVTDLETNNISLLNPDGTVITQFGSWGSGDYQFNHPTHATVDCRDNIIISDAGNSFIKIFDKNGVFLHKFNLQTSKQGLLRRPHGVAMDKSGNVLIADHDNHRISMFSFEGTFLRHILTKQDGIRYPTGVCLDPQNNHIAVVESHVGFLSKDPHHAVKLFQLI